MPIFVHLTSEKDIQNIKRNGIKSSKIHSPDISKGVFCMPVIDDFYSTHQWGRELKRGGKKNIIAVYFKINDIEQVRFGNYNEKQCIGNAGKAVEIFVNLNDRMGYQVIIPRDVTPKEIHRVKYLPQIIGWRYYPKAHGKRPCLCPACIGRGEYNTNNYILDRYNEMISKLRLAETNNEKASILLDIHPIIQDHKKRIKQWDEILNIDCQNDDNLKSILVSVLSTINTGESFKVLLGILEKGNDEIKARCVDEILMKKGKRGFKYIESYFDLPSVKTVIDEYNEYFNEEPD